MLNRKLKYKFVIIVKFKVLQRLFKCNTLQSTSLIVDRIPATSRADESYS